MRLAFLTTTAIFLVLSAPSVAADFAEKFESSKPAVSGINGKLEFAYDYLDEDELDGHLNLYSASGSVSVPVADQFGLQIDAGVGQLDLSNFEGNTTAVGVGAHGFWRDPNTALLGAYGHYVRLSGDGEDSSVWRLGAEAEAYLDRVSIETFVGADIIDSDANNDTYFSGDLVAAFYPSDNLRLHAGVGHQFDQTFAKLGGEAMMPFASNNVSLFADGNIGGDVQSYQAGLRIYFGEAGKSLKARHREDDPKNRLLNFWGIGSLDADEVEHLPPPPCGEC